MRSRMTMLMVCAVFMLSIATGSALAAGPTWDGTYVGVHAGTGSADMPITPTGSGGFAETCNMSENGFIGGLHAGHNWQFGSSVFGVEAGWTNVGIEKSLGGTDYKYKTGIDNIFSVLGKVGLAVDKCLIYVTAGMASGDLTGSYVQPSSPGSSFADLGGTEAGWIAGVGFEHKLPYNNLSFKLEGFYTDFGSITSTSTDGDSKADTAYSASLFKFGVNYNFK